MRNKSNQSINGNQNKVAGKDFYDYSSQTIVIGENIPLRFFDKDIKDIIIEFAKIANKDIGLNYNFKRIAAQDKNKINKLSQRYFEDHILENSIFYFHQIDDFLKSPSNKTYLRMYENTVEELNQKITIFSEMYSKFDFVFNDLYEQIFNNNESELRTDRRLIWVMLHFMYWKCDIGKGGEIGNVNPS